MASSRDVDHDPDAPAALKGFLVTGTSWALVGMLAGLVGAFAVNALGARLLPPGPFGTFLLVVSAAQALGVIGELGLPPLVTRELARSERGLDAGTGPRWLTGALVLAAVACVALAAAGWLLGPPLADRVFADHPGLGAVAGLLGLVVAARVGERLLPDAFRGLRDIRRATIYGPAWTQVLAAVGLAVLLATTGAASLTQVVVLYGGVGVLGAALAAWRLRDVVAPLATVDRPLVARMLREGWPVAGHRALLVVVQQADLWLVGALLLAEDTARYGAALRLVLLVSVPLLVVNQVVPPLVAAMTETGETRRLERALRVTATLAGAPALAILLTFAVAGAPLLTLVYGPFYADAAPILTILSLGHLVNVWAGSCGIVLVQTGHQRVLLTTSAVAGAVLVVGAAAAARPFGTIGVAVAASLAQVVQNVLMVRAVRRRVGVRTTVDPGAIRPALREGRALLRRITR